MNATQKNLKNVLIINFDHQALHQWGYYGDTVPYRPNFQRLTDKGCQFSSAYCAAPLCGPSRRTLLTGLYPHAHGQIHNETNPAYDKPMYITELNRLGYENYYFGKWHAGPGSAMDHGCKGFSLEHYGNPYCTMEYMSYCNRYGLPLAEHMIQNCFVWASEGQRAYAKGAEKYPMPEKGKRYRSQDPRHCCEAAYGVTVTPKETHESFFLAALVCEQMEKLVQSGTTTPFCIRVDFWGPHYPYFPTQEYLNLYRNVSFRQYASFEYSMRGKPEVYFTERHIPIGDNNRITIPNALGWSAYDEMLHYCAAEITMLDAAVGKILDKLSECGLDQNTSIIWTADHGDGLACHGGHFDKGSYLSQEVLRVPLAIYAPDRQFVGKEIPDPVCTVDFAATVLDLAGVNINRWKGGGKSLLRLAEKGEHQEAVLSESYGLGYGEYITARAAISNEWKYVATKGQVHELYHIETDPFELNNLINDPAYQDKRIEMQNRLRSLQLATNDPENILP